MKLKILSLVAAAGLFAASCGTTHQSTTSDNAAYNVDVPTNVRSGFAIAYPDATNVMWNHYDITTVPIDWDLAGWTVLSPADYAVTFNMGNDQYYAWYDANGNLIGTSTLVRDNNGLPYAVNNLLRDKYSGYTIDKIEKEMKNSKTAYEIKLTNGSNNVKLLVDSDGTILKEK